MLTPTRTYKPLNPKQYEILQILYRFRFATTSLLTAALNTNSKIKMNERLTVLLEQEYIGRKYDSEYRLQRKHASYYLLTKGVNALKQQMNSEHDEAVLYNIRKDRTASDRFINHCLAIFECYCVLKARYGDALRFFTKSQTAQYDYFPQPLPDAYIRFKDRGLDKNFFLELIREDQPYFAAVRKVKQHVRYAEEGEWESTNTELPAVLLVCASASLQKRLSKAVLRISDDTDEDISFYLTTDAEFRGISRTGDIWHDPATPDEALNIEAI